MIRKLEKHLTSLFFFTTSGILTLVLVIAFFYQTRLNSSQETGLFQSQLLDLTHRLEGTSGFSDDWLSSLEADGHLIIHIEDNGTPLFFPGAWTPRTTREDLVKLAKNKALKEGVDTRSKPHSLSISKSSLFTVKGEHHDTYMATVLVISADTGFRSMVLLSDTSELHREFFFQLLLFLLLETLGILSLYITSCKLVKQAVKPIEIYHEKQNEFISAASHELRSPLAVIQTSASVIKTMPERAEKMAGLIERECIRSGNLLKNLLLLSSAEESFIPSTENVEIDSVLLQILENYEMLCKSKGISLKLKLPKEFLPEIHGNAQWIYQILCILLDNAISYGCDCGSEIILDAKTDRQFVTISVVDHGIGIPDAMKPHVFDRFYRADASRNDKQHSGLGLSIAKMLADRMHTSILIKDTPGGGATFEMKFYSVKAE